MTRPARHYFWNAVNTETLKQHWAKGLSAGQIGERLGCSRNAVQAKLVRLGLHRRRYRGHKPLIVAMPKRRGDPPYELNRVVAIVRKSTRLTPVNFTKAELYAMLAEAARNTVTLRP